VAIALHLDKMNKKLQATGFLNVSLFARMID
jgi:hypothetical protein